MQTHERVYFGGIFYLTAKNSEEQVLLFKETLLKEAEPHPRAAAVLQGWLRRNAFHRPPNTA